MQLRYVIHKKNEILLLSSMKSILIDKLRQNLEYNMEEITSSVVLPVTDAQMAAFSAWIQNTYVTYDGFMGAIKSPEIDTYIQTHILPIEMVNVLRRSERFRGEKRGDVNIQRLLLYRRRVTAKMNNLKGKVGTVTFPIEAAQARRENRVAATARRQHREATQLRLDREALAYRNHMFATYGDRVREAVREDQERITVMTAKVYPYPPIVKIQLSEEDAKTCVMDDDCAICLQKHMMTDACKINCGHQFGSACLAKWKRYTCPLCRTPIKEKTVFIYTYLKDAETEQTILEQLAVVA
jgi:hypothetical protein